MQYCERKVLGIFVTIIAWENDYDWKLNFDNYYSYNVSNNNYTYSSTKKIYN